ncbi:dephospho-CoA kinase [Suttonella ornithocola]|uniref:Dephospho-CoA kinase n=1 Tax=Suttonella ornithocola TaxID=279832 RepID=A0A380MQP5_9GAMM|nr:dephospho-CoA kinase [Suttonella ornithocola]SUO94386.1 Dephospho-CoA kinase [Suttonella ornithocola]
MIIGLTGGIASGKSLCTDFFIAKGISTVDADIIAKSIVQKDSPILRELVNHFGNGILLADSSLNRSALRERIFSDLEAKKILDKIMHPIIEKKSQDAIFKALKSQPLVIYSAPLLIENKLNKLCNSVIVIDIPIELQIIRGAKRDNVSKKQLIHIISSQSSRIEKLSYANYVVDNSQEKEKTFQQCEKILEQILKSITNKKPK